MLRPNDIKVGDENWEKFTLLEKWCYSGSKHEGYYPGSRSYRNHNPGNFRCSNLVMGELGAIRCDDNFAVFPDFETGWAAMAQFITYAADGSLRAYDPEMTLYEFYAVYAPGGDWNYPKGYAEAVAKDLGIPATTKIKNILDNNVPTSTEETMDKDFVKAVGEVCGKDYGENLNESEQKEATRKLKDTKVELLAAGQLRLTNARLMENNSELLEKNRDLGAEKENLIAENTRLAYLKLDISSYSISGLIGEIIKRLTAK